MSGPLDLPSEKMLQLSLHRAFLAMKQEPSPILPWLEIELKKLDVLNRWEPAGPLLSQKQGHAQAISQLVELIHNPEAAIAELETAIRAQRRNEP